LKVQIHKMDSPFVKRNYPKLHDIFINRTEEPGEGYAKFRQIGMELKLKAKEKQINRLD